MSLHRCRTYIRTMRKETYEADQFQRQKDTHLAGDCIEHHRAETEKRLVIGTAASDHQSQRRSVSLDGHFLCTECVLLFHDRAGLFDSFGPKIPTSMPHEVDKGLSHLLSSSSCCISFVFSCLGMRHLHGKEGRWALCARVFPYSMENRRLIMSIL